MLFIFCVGVEAGPNFFPFFRDGKNYLMLALVLVGSALLIALGLGEIIRLGYRPDRRDAGRFDDLNASAGGGGRYAAPFRHGERAAFQRAG